MGKISAILQACLLLCAGCTVSSAVTDAGDDGEDAADLPDQSGAADSGLDASDTSDRSDPPDAEFDASSDAGADATPDSGLDGGFDGGWTWEGPPWYGCPGKPDPAGSTNVIIFDRADQYYDAADDRRAIEKTAELPAAQDWKKITFRLLLECPDDGWCDAWDRFANFSVLMNPGSLTPVYLEMDRYITPYGIGMCFETDATRFASVLSGTRTFRSAIDTWVGPKSTAYGHGWRVSAALVFEPGTPAAAPPEIINLLTSRYVVIGDPANPIPDQAPIPPVDIASLPAKAELRVLATGHGQGNLNNCGEFCSIAELMTVNGNLYSYDLWRWDCSLNPIGPKQKGTWQYQRNGWCPGAYVVPAYSDVTERLKAAPDNKFEYGVLLWNDKPYVNTCRPGQGGPTNTCTGCVFDYNAGNCDYNGGNHTGPVINVSAVLFLYK
jgi:hypothetical protein